jgi:predicted ABC-type ATPase
MQQMIIIGGANGSGKTTFSKEILALTGFHFLNADEIEKELATSKIQAGKEFFKRLNEIISQQEDFVLESTLSGGYLVKVIEKARKNNYTIKLVYVFLENPEECILRIKLRVALGGHFIPDEDVQRRFYRSKENFWKIYRNLTDDWIMIYNSATENPQKVAIGEKENYIIELEELFDKFLKDISL